MSDKLTPKSDKCFFMGYPRESKGNYFYNKAEGKVFVAHCGVFMEKEFLSKELSGSMSKWFYDTSAGIATRAARCGSLLERAWLAQGVSYEGTWWTRGFTWFEPPERNILCPQGNESCIAVFCSSVGFALVILTFV
jgi:hypothetical protein